MVGFVLFIILVWIVIPLIILSMFIFSLIIVFATSDSDQRISVRSAFFAGLLLFVIYAISQLHTIRTPTISNDLTEFNRTDLIVAVISFIIGFLLLWGIQIIIPLRVLGLITFILSASSWMGLFSYVFSSSVRDIGLYIICSTLLGILFHLTFNPKVLREIANSI